MVSLHMKLTKFDKAQGGTSGPWGSYNTWKYLEMLEQFISSWDWQRLEMLTHQWYKVGLQRG